MRTIGLEKVKGAFLVAQTVKKSKRNYWLNQKKDKGHRVWFLVWFFIIHQLIDAYIPSFI